jgi:hypothetical protein
VKVLSYGDDLLMSVRPWVKKHFTATSYAKFVKEVLGMKFTTASKGEVKDDFVRLDTMSFLKRSFYWHESYSRYCAKLSLDSLMKALMWRLPSKELSEESQMVMTSPPLCGRHGSM